MTTAAARPLLAALLLLVVQGCAGVGDRIGSRSAEGALNELERALEEVPPEQRGVVGERNARAAVRAALEELASPESQAHLRTVVDQAISQAFESAVHPWSEAGGRAGGESGWGGSAPPMEDLGRQLAQGLTNAMMLQLSEELGGDGTGRLSQALSASADRVSASAALGIRRELESFVGPCSDPDPRKCLDRRLHELGKAASAGAMEGIRLPLLVLTFALGFSVCLLVMQLLATIRRRSARGEQLEKGRRKGVPA